MKGRGRDGEEPIDWLPPTRTLPGPGSRPASAVRDLDGDETLDPSVRGRALRPLGHTGRGCATSCPRSVREVLLGSQDADKRNGPSGGQAPEWGAARTTRRRGGSPCTCLSPGVTRLTAPGSALPHTPGAKAGPPSGPGRGGPSPPGSLSSGLRFAAWCAWGKRRVYDLQTHFLRI